MIILSFANLLTKATKPRFDEDWVDKLNNRWAAYIFIAAGITIFGNNLGGNPIQCWSKPNWHSSWGEFASDFCFVEGTFFANLNETLPKNGEYEKYKKLVFYQWTPFVFTLLGLLFTLPQTFWSFVNWSSSFHMTTILTDGCKAKKSGFPTRESIKLSINHLTNILSRYQRVTKMTVMKRLGTRMFGSYFLTTCYIVVKIMNILCVILSQIILSNVVADEHTDLLGLETIKTLTLGKNWRTTGIFPRLTVCRFMIREPGINHDTTFAPQVTQCVLLTNMYIEKMYFVLWYGLSILLVLNILNLLQFIYIFTRGSRKYFLEDLMHSSYEFVLPDLENDLKWLLKSRHHQHNIDNKLKHLHNVQREGKAEEIEIARRQHVIAKHKAKDCKQEALKKRSEKRAKYVEYLNNDIDAFIDYLGADGYLAIRLMYSNAGNYAAGGIASKLFWKFAKKQDKHID